MLGLAILPMLGVLLLTNALRPEADTRTGERRDWQTAIAAADLTQRLAGLEDRLLAVAADPALQQLTDGVSGSAERQVAATALAALAGGDEAVIQLACLTRASTATGIALGGTDAALAAASGGDAGTGVSGVCASPDLMTAALGAGPGGVVRDTRWVDGQERHLTLSTRLSSPGRREAAVLTADIDLAHFLETTSGLVDEAGGAALVDLSTSTVLAGAGIKDLEAGAGTPGTRALGDLRVHITGIASGHAGTSRALAAAGWTSTAVPLWQAVDGARFALIQLWPVVKGPDATLLLAALVAFAVTVLAIAAAVARTFLQPFDDLARSQSQLEVLYREAREDSLHDGLTGLGNHRSFQEELDRQLETHRRHKVPVALLLIDLDDLKVVNDGEGHPAGDRLLVSMANSIRDALRYGDRAFRIGGDEFAVILPHTEAPDALVAANRLRHFCLRPAPGERAIPFSGGISSVPQLAADRDELFRQADAALYRCKRNGRGTVEIFDADRDLAPETSADQGAIRAVRDVIRARDLTPVYQPIVDLRDGRVLGFEGLIRPAPDTPFSNPGQLFAAAAAAGRTVELDLACFEIVAAGSCRDRRRPGRHHQPLAAHARGRRTSRPRGCSRCWRATSSARAASSSSSPSARPSPTSSDCAATWPPCSMAGCASPPTTWAPATPACGCSPRCASTS